MLRIFSNLSHFLHHLDYAQYYKYMNLASISKENMNYATLTTLLSIYVFSHNPNIRFFSIKTF